MAKFIIIVDEQLAKHDSLRDANALAERQLTLHPETGPLIVAKVMTTFGHERAVKKTTHEVR